MSNEKKESIVLTGYHIGNGIAWAGFWIMIGLISLGIWSSL